MRLAYIPGPCGAIWKLKTTSDKVKSKPVCQTQRSHLSCTRSLAAVLHSCLILADCLKQKNALGNWRQLVPSSKTLALPYVNVPTGGLNSTSREASWRHNKEIQLSADTCIQEHGPKPFSRAHYKIALNHSSYAFHVSMLRGLKLQATQAHASEAWVHYLAVSGQPGQCE